MLIHKDNIFEAFQSTLFIDECGVNTKLEAFQEVEKMFQSEIEKLLDVVKNTVEDDKSEPILSKIGNIKNIRKTMSDLIKNIVGEIDDTRE